MFVNLISKHNLTVEMILWINLPDLTEEMILWINLLDMTCLAEEMILWINLPDKILVVRINVGELAFL